jgi:hypothetical protein
MSARPKTVKITQTSPRKASIVCKLVDVDTFAGGVGGWSVNDVKRDKQSTAWTGLPALVYTLPIRLDGVTPRGQRSVEAEIKILLAMGQPGSSDGKITDPPILGLTGNVQTSATIKWVLTNLTPGEMRRDQRGVIVQQDFVLELTEYVAATAKGKPAKNVKDKLLAKAKAPVRTASAMHGQ